MDKRYVDTVRLLLEAAPEVFRTDIFAMKGGTALNLFVQEMPRLSVDIDVVYVPHTKGRAEALAEIATELGAIQRRLEGLGIEAEFASSRTGEDPRSPRTPAGENRSQPCLPRNAAPRRASAIGEDCERPVHNFAIGTDARNR